MMASTLRRRETAVGCEAQRLHRRIHMACLEVPGQGKKGGTEEAGERGGNLENRCEQA